MAKGVAFPKRTRNGWPITTHWSRRPIRVQCTF